MMYSNVELGVIFSFYKHWNSLIKLQNVPPKGLIK